MFSQSALQDDNERLNAELREARAHIRNLELQVEGLKANAQRAAKALLESQ
jgi:coronin-1B/1C/6